MAVAEEKTTDPFLQAAALHSGEQPEIGSEHSISSGGAGTAGLPEVELCLLSPDAEKSFCGSCLAGNHQHTYSPIRMF